MIFAVMMVRNEADVLRVNVLHHLDLGIDQFLVVDNGSSDGTDDVLRDLSASGRVHWRRSDGPFDQPETTTELAREAFLRGARWVLPIDADEFWWADGNDFRETLRASSAGALEVEVVNFIQSRACDAADPRALLTMTRRAPEPVGSVADGPELVEACRIGFVEMRYSPKYVSRASIMLAIAPGNHGVSGIDGPIEKSRAIVCLHAPLRARAILETRKVEHGRRIEEISRHLQHAWHVRRWRRLSEEGRMAEEWAANSYLDDCLDVYGTKHPVVIDNRLRDVVSRWVDAEPGGDWNEDADPAETAAIVARMREIDGWLRDEEAELLVRLVRRAVEGQDAATIVEIGSYCGKSTMVLARAAKTASPTARVYAVDPHEGEIGAGDSSVGVSPSAPTLERFLANVSAAGVADVVQPIVRRSVDVAWQGPIALLFIDGLHDYSSVSRDFAHFERWLADGAYVAFHDCDDNYPGVIAAVAGIVASGGYREVGRVHSLVVLRKLAGSTPVASTPDGQELATLRIRSAQQEKGIAFLMSELAKRAQTIREREEGIEWLQSVVATHEATIAEREKGIAWLQEVVADREKAIRWLEQEAKNHARAAQELDTLKQSRAWRFVELFRSFRRPHR